MEQAAFEEAIAKYAKRINSVIPEYEINLHNRRKVIDLRSQCEVPTGPRKNVVAYGRPLITPEGSFISVREAALHYKKSTMWVYNQIHKGEGFTYDKQR